MPSQRHKIRKSPKSSPSQNQNTGSLRIRDDIDGDFGKFRSSLQLINVMQAIPLFKQRMISIIMLIRISAL